MLKRSVFLLCLLAGCAVYAGEDSMTTTDYAIAANQDAWLRHPVYGDPSFDAFVRVPGNPVVCGEPPYEWPVNGSLFRDPVSGNWYLYVGYYQYGYALSKETPTHCRVHRAASPEGPWEEVGKVFADEPFCFEGEVSPKLTAPDVVVVHANGRYHMIFDWCSANTTWQNAHNPGPEANSGVGYAWSERPEGPFQIEKRPVLDTRSQAAIVGKYRRMYASSIVKRKDDWLVLTLTDSGPNFGWALVGTTSKEPEGPYGEAKLLLHPNSDGFHPPLMEFFPAFAHEGYVYAPATSVALNRNFQTLFRAPIEDAHKPEAWEIHQLGSLWHSEPVEEEHYGIWGQTFSGVVDQGTLWAMFPSRDSRGWGTINLAQRPWNQPCRERGFVVSGHEGPSIVRLKRDGELTDLTVEIEPRQGAVTLAWAMGAPLAPNAARSDAQPHALTLANYAGLRLTEDSWAVVLVDEAGSETRLAEGKRPAGAGEVTIAWQDYSASVRLGGDEVWHGNLPNDGGVGLITDPWSNAKVNRFEVSGIMRPATFTWLYTEGLLEAAQNMAHWEERKGPEWRHGVGTVSTSPEAEAKFSFEGEHFALWAPRGDFGKAFVYLDGEPVEVLDFGAETPQPSSVLLDRDVPPGRHAVTVKAKEGSFPVDFLETRCAE